MKHHLNRLGKLSLWVGSVILGGFIIGRITRPFMRPWYDLLVLSSLTPPGYVFPIVWTVLYGLLGACGEEIWHYGYGPHGKKIKILYILQLVLNGAWSPLFFGYHLVGAALVTVIGMNILTLWIMGSCYKSNQKIFYLIMPYELWILFATYLTFYIWIHN